MAGERQDSSWVIHPSLWFDAVCLIPLLAGLPFYTSRDPVTRWTTAGGGMHALALLLHDTLRRGGYDPAVGSYADFLTHALSDRNTWPRDLEARYLERTAAGHS